VRDASSKNYKLGYRLSSLVGSLLSTNERSERVRASLRILADRTGETVHYCVLDRDATVLVYKASGTQLVAVDFNVGDRSPLHCTSIGKALSGPSSRFTLKKLRELRDEALIIAAELSRSLGLQG